MIYRMASISRLRHFLTLNISETVRDEILIVTNMPYSTVSFQMTLSDLANYSMTRNVVQSLCDSKTTKFHVIPNPSIYSSLKISP